MEKRKAAQKKAMKLKEIAHDFLQAKKEVPTGIKESGQTEARKKEIMDILNASEDDWNDWHWQLDNRISDVETISKVLNLEPGEEGEIETVGKKFRWATTPYYASLMDPDDRNCPVRMQMIPKNEELDLTGKPDFSGEEMTSPVERVVRWYPDRVIINSTNMCAAYCR
ncbi:MAG TPA: lysine 2,3-aminomutase, partial [Euryarchaeota archaeon]|nr:lysine 2,3-aminomutase [Euryarchaeota archaeon]